MGGRRGGKPLTDSLGTMDHFELIRSDFGWSARPLIQEVRS
ncbi:hypothetical protein [Bradyrhizobium vignae]|nr:hypothetical protein [Bradyrhizobium vignae]